MGSAGQWAMAPQGKTPGSSSVVLGATRARSGILLNPAEERPASANANATAKPGAFRDQCAVVDKQSNAVACW